jgi:hypothetical protein
MADLPQIVRTVIRHRATQGRRWLLTGKPRSSSATRPPTTGTSAATRSCATTGMSARADKGTAKRLNLFWSNTETIKPAIYSKTPQSIVERRFLDKDTTGRVASTILERALRYEVSSCGYDRSAVALATTTSQ